jgi:hypothetical protein
MLFPLLRYPLKQGPHLQRAEITPLRGRRVLPQIVVEPAHSLAFTVEPFDLPTDHDGEVEPRLDLRADDQREVTGRDAPEGVRL